MITDPWFYAVAIPATIIMGLSKGGFTTIGLLTVPLMALVISPVQAAAITLPLLVLSDVVAVASYWRDFDKTTVAIMLPAGMIGVGIGWLTAAWVTEYEIRLIIGIMSVVFAAHYFLRGRHRPHPHPQNVPKGLFWGTLSGFTSFVSHAGGPPFQIYAAPLRLAPKVLASTSVMVFAAVNLTKVVPYYFLGQFDAANLKTSAVLLPLAVVTTLSTVWLIKRIDRTAYYTWIYLAILVIGIYLVAEALAELA